MFLVATSHLPDDPVYDWMRVSTRLPETGEQFGTAMRLMHEQKLSKLKEETLERVVMEFFIDGKSPIELKAELAAERALRAQIEAERAQIEAKHAQIEAERAKEREKFEKEIESLKSEISRLKK